MTGRPPGRPRLTPAVPEEPPAVDDGAALEALEPEELATEALEGRERLTPDIVRALNETWRDVVQGDDEGSKQLARRIVARLRRASHREIHPGCNRVTIDVPMLPNRAFVRINERAYFGPVEVWDCEARTILELVHRARVVEAARLDDKGGGGFLDLDSPLAERARAIQRA
jgi:hypothetical protein